jgi:excisionase family DNA binding protein
MTTLLTVREVTQRYRCSRWFIYDLVKAGHLQAVRLSSRRLLFDEKDVEAAIEKAKQQASPALATAQPG